MTCIVTVQSQVCGAWWNLNVFINDFPLPCRRVQNQYFHDIRLRRAVLKLSVSTFIWC